MITADNSYEARAILITAGSRRRKLEYSRRGKIRAQRFDILRHLRRTSV